MGNKKNQKPPVDLCHHFHSDLDTAVRLVKRDIIFDTIKVIAACFVLWFLIDHFNKTVIKLEFSLDNLIAALGFVLDLKIINDLRDSYKKIFKLKNLRDYVKRIYPTAVGSCKNETCIMMKRVMDGTFN